MNCNLFPGQQAYYKPARIVCGNFLTPITSSQSLWFALKVVNPALPAGYSHLSVPFFIYSVEQGSTVRTNFDVIENAVFLRNDYNTYNDVAGAFSTQQNLQNSGVGLNLISRNSWNINGGSYYVVYFNFPLRNNGKVSGGCTYPNNSSYYGDAYYHLNNWVIVCAVANNAMGVPGGGYTTRNVQFTGFFTPFYYLTPAERVILGYGYNPQTRATCYGQYSDSYPN